MLPPDFDSIDRADLRALIGEAESRYLDFKLDWGKDSQATMVGLAADVCAFANTDGGDIVIGIAEKNRIAKAVRPIHCDNVDQRIRNTESGVRSRIEPAVAGIRIMRLPAAGAKGVYVIRVPPSTATPHRSNNIFYGRASAGNYEMDISQIREAFLRGTIAEERIREFRKDRVASLRVSTAANSYPLWLILHVVSVPAMLRHRLADPKAILASSALVRPLGGNKSDHTVLPIFNLDGVRKSVQGEQVQLYRDGRVEGKLLLQNHSLHQRGAVDSVPLRRIRDSVKVAIGEYVRFLESLDFPPPYAVMLSLVNCTTLDFSSKDEDHLTLDRHTAELPDVLILDTQQASIDAAFRSIGDLLYQCFGIPEMELNTKG